MAAETETTGMPEELDVAGAVALMANLPDDAAEEPHAALASREPEENPDPVADVGRRGGEAAKGRRADGEPSAEEEGEDKGETEATPGEEPPGFWSAEDRAL